MLKQLLASSTLMGLLWFGGVSTAQAQQTSPQPGMPPAPQMEITATDLERFAMAVQQIQAIEQQAQAQMVEAIQGEGLTVERFNEIAQSQQNPEMQVQLSDQEAQTFAQAIQQISQIHQAAEQEMQAAVQDEGLAVDEFNQIAQTVQQDPTLQRQVLELLQK